MNGGQALSDYTEADTRLRLLDKLQHMQSRTGAFQVNSFYNDRFSETIETPFLTALIVLLLLRNQATQQEGGEIISRAVFYLSRQVQQASRVGFFGVERNYSADVDDTALVYETLERTKTVFRTNLKELARGRMEVLSQVSSDGLVSIWFAGETRGTNEDWVVSSNVARYLKLIGNPHYIAIETRIRTLINKFGLASPYYPNRLLILALNAALDPDSQILLSIAQERDINVSIKGIHTAVNGTLNNRDDISLALCALGTSKLSHKAQLLKSSVGALQCTLAGPILCQHIRRNIKYRAPALQIALLAKLLSDTDMSI